jgi:uncharacterized membrane protein
MDERELHGLAIESRREAGPAVGVVIGLQLLLALVSRERGWELWTLPWWVWLVPVLPELGLVVALTWSWPRRQLEQLGHRRTAALTLVGVVGAANVAGLVALVGALMAGRETNGAELLLKGVTIWTTNVVAFGLCFWELDRGGPVRRLRPDSRPPDFQFPQMENPQLAEPGWRPHLFDYVYVAFTNAIAFSPTDAMPLTQRAKVLMLLESAASVLTLLLVAARAVNILGQ